MEIQTALGPIVLAGRNTGKPVLLTLAGLFVSPNFGCGMQAHWPEFDVVIGRVPGDGVPALAHPSIGVFAAAYTEALATTFPSRPIFGYGISTGALIALGLRGEIRGLLLIEPPLRTCGLWPLRDALRDVGPEGWETLAGPIFGITATRHDARDYRPILDALKVPTTALVGARPLMPRRPLPDQPSLVDDDSRAALRAAGVNVVEVPEAGHAILNRAPDVVEFQLRMAMASAGFGG